MSLQGAVGRAGLPQHAMNASWCYLSSASLRLSNSTLARHLYLGVDFSGELARGRFLIKTLWKHGGGGAYPLAH